MEDKKVDILAIGAHPDDVELGCAGVLAKEILKGKKVAILDLTRGELGSRGTPELRAKEALAAAQILGVSQRVQLGLEDGFFTNDKQHVLEIIKVIRDFRPEIVLCNTPDDRHSDHAKASKLVSEACFLSGLVKIDTSQPFWRPKVVYHYIQWKITEPDFVVDISDVLDLKIKSVMSYKSQFYDPDSQESETPISSKNFLDSIVYRAKDLGRIIGKEAAEGFTVERYPAVKSLFDLI